MTENSLLNGALWYAQNLGWKILPIWGLRPDGKCDCNEPHSSPKDIGKHAILSGTHESRASSDPAVITEWWTKWPNANIGVWAKGSGILALDVDPRSGGDESFARFEELVEGTMPETWHQYSGNYPVRGRTHRGSHYIFKAPPGYAFHVNLKPFGLDGVDIKHNGYFMAYPSRHLTGVQYEWDEKAAPWTQGGPTVADLSPEMMRYMAKEAHFMDGTTRVATGSLDRGTSVSGRWDFLDKTTLPEGSPADIKELIKNGLSEGGRAVSIYRLAIYYANKYGTDSDDVEHIISTMQKYNYEKVSPPLEAEELMRQVTKGIAFAQRNPLPKYEMQAGFREKNEAFIKEKVEERSVAKPGTSVTTSEPLAPQVMPLNTSDADDWALDNSSVMDSVPTALDSDALTEEEGGIVGARSYSDMGNGRRFIDAFGNRVRYTPGLGWFVWNDKYWRPDVENLNVREMVKRVPAIIANEAAGVEDKDLMKAAQKWARETKSSAAQANTLKMSQTDSRIGVPVDFWDRDPFMLGVNNGVLDLRTCTLFQGQPDLHITRRAPVKYEPGFESLPRFQEFLDFATGYDKQYQAWLQRAMGYTLTGLNTLDVMFLMYGPPGSGKNVMVEALVKILGTKQYAFPLDSSILADGDGRSNPADMYHWAELRGRRMVWVDELPESERIKENAVKKLTGSSEISARSPGEKPFTFESQAKLWITTNHRPIITDDAMWRRIRPIPWTQVPTKADPSLKQYLHDPEGGLPAILAWAAQGAMQVINSVEPDPVGWCEQVQEAAEVYRKNEDRIGLFIEEEFEEDVTSVLGIKDIYEPYTVWCQGRGERPLSQIRLTNKLTERGVQITGSGNRAVAYGYKRRALPEFSAPGINTIDWNSILGKD